VDLLSVTLWERVNSEMRKYKLQPWTIEAIQWDGSDKQGKEVAMCVGRSWITIVNGLLVIDAPKRKLYLHPTDYLLKYSMNDFMVVGAEDFENICEPGDG
jgi:hypothetical protein